MILSDLAVTSCDLAEAQTDLDLVTPPHLPVYLADLAVTSRDLAEAQTDLDLVTPSDLPVDLSDLAEAQTDLDLVTCLTWLLPRVTWLKFRLTLTW